MESIIIFELRVPPVALQRWSIATSIIVLG